MEDKTTYWKNREAGKRGQGEYFNPVIAATAPEDVVQGAPRSRKARRLVEAHTTGRKRREGGA